MNVKLDNCVLRIKAWQRNRLGSPGTAARQQQHCHKWQATRARPPVTRASAEPASTSTSRPAVIASRYGDLTWASCVSSKPTVNSAVQDAADRIMQQQQGSFQPDLAIVFASCNYGSQLQDVVKAVRRAAPSVTHIFGCSAFGVVGSSTAGCIEVEGEPGISLTLAALPGVEVSLMHTLRSSIPTEDASPEAWCDLVGMSPLEALSTSTPTSATASADEEDAPDTTSTSSSSSSSSSSSNSSQTSSGSSVAPAADSSSKPISSNTANEAAAAANALLGSSSQQLQQQQLGAAVSFLVLCDPRFQQSKQLLAGLDFAFPNSNKVGAVLSQGQQNKRRLMFVWSADGSVQPGSAAWTKQQQKRRQQQAARMSGSTAVSVGSSSSSGSDDQQQQQQQQLVQATAGESQQQQQQQQEAEHAGPKGKRKGLFGSLFDALLSGLADEEQQQGTSSSSSSAKITAAATDAAAAAASSTTSAGGEGGEGGRVENEEDEPPGSGVFMYGAAVLSMKGPLTLEPVTCQGYRTVSDKVWTIGQTSRDGDLIGTLINPDAGDSDDDEAEGEGEGEVVPLLAIYELLMSAGYDPEGTSSEWIEELSTKLAVAIAPDSWTPSEQLTQDDFQVAAISEVWQKTGYIRVDGQARPGYRLRLVLRDEKGIREDLSNKMLGLKRTELAGVLTGKAQPPPLAALLFSDIGRGSALYDTPSYEAGLVSSYLPVPMAGMFGSAQISTVNKKAALYELSSAIAVLRPLASTAGAGSSAPSLVGSQQGEA